VNDDELDRIEQELAIRLPAAYRVVMASKGGEFRALTYRLDGRDVPYFGDDLWLNTDEFISTNKVEREPGMGTSYAFPKWWKTFFMFATNGGGDYYCLRLDNGPGVWMIGSDCGSEPTQTDASLVTYIKGRLAEYMPEVTSPPPPPPPPAVDDSFDPAERDRYADWKYDIPADEKRALRAVLADSADDAARLKFADWLEKHDQAARAGFVRARVALDGRPPMPDTYPDAVELLREAAHGLSLPDPELPPGFSFYGYDTDLHEWWSDDSDSWERGLPSLAKVDEYNFRDANTLASQVKRALPALVGKTPIRGVDFEWHIARHMRSILAEPAAAALTRIEFDSRPEEGELCPVIDTLRDSPVARNLTRLNFGGNLRDDLNTAALADTPFDRLRRFDVNFIAASPPAARRLFTAAWFRRLRRLKVGFPGEGETAEHLAGMPDLHTLCLWFPNEAALKAIGRGAGFPSLRRLFVHAADLRGDVSAALAEMRCPGLVELWLRNSAIRKADVRNLLAAPWAARLQVLTLECTLPDADVLNVIGDSPCAAHLRILRFHYNGFPTLAGTAFARPGAFPRLTSLEFRSPFNPDDPSVGKEPAVKDTAKFLRTLQTPALKYLKLDGCGYDAKCAKAIEANPTLRGVQRLDT
jgi:uncharacterized protein (TIGR02996 family)